LFSRRQRQARKTGNIFNINLGGGIHETTKCVDKKVAESLFGNRQKATSPRVLIFPSRFVTVAVIYQ
jgi:hypothetical protein